MTLAALTALSCAVGCGGETDDDASSDSAAAVRETSIENTAGAFAVDYGLGFLAARHLEDIPRDKLLEELPPEGDARRYAQCLEVRRDTVKGDTLSGHTWDYEGQRYYVLKTELKNANGLEDVHMMFVFSSDGVSRFQVLTWDGRRNVKIAYRSGAPCV